MAYTLTGLVKRSDKGAALSGTEMDGNWTAIKAFCDTVGLVFNPDGSFDTAELQTAMQTYLATAFINSTSGFLPPVGDVRWMPVQMPGQSITTSGATVVLPSGDVAVYVLCNGGKLVQADFPRLFSLLSTTFNGPTMNGVAVGDGTIVAAGQFRVPDIRGRGLLMYGGSIAPSALGGEASHRLTWNEMPPHAHNYKQPSNINALAAGNNSGFWFGSQTDAWTDKQGGNGDNTGLGAPHNNYQPYISGYHYILAGYKVGGDWV